MKQVISKKQRKSSRKASVGAFSGGSGTSSRGARKGMYKLTEMSVKPYHITNRYTNGERVKGYQDPLYNAYSKLLEEKSNAA